MNSFLPPLEDLNPDQRAIYDILPLDLTRCLLLTRSSTVPYLSLGQSFHDGFLSPSIRELIILRVAHGTKSEYEMFHHIPQARACGVPDDILGKVVAGAATVNNDRLDAVLAFVDQLIEGVQNVLDGTAVVQKYFSHNEIAEMTLLVGHYVMTSLFAKAMQITPEVTSAAPSDGANFVKHSHAQINES